MRLSSKTIIFAAVIMLAGFSQAASLVVGEKLSPIRISDLGECVITGDNTEFEPWNSDSMNGKVYIFEYLAARSGIDDIHRSFYEKIKVTDFPAATVGIIKVVNSNDAMWGTSGLVPAEIRKNKLQLPEDRLVIDAQGIGLKQWDLQKKNAAIAILDQQGRVLFFKEGSMTNDEIAAGIAAIQQQIKVGQH